jgi:dTDP-4-dehydrorhamnose reductase
MKILLLGKFGQLGSELACVLTNLGDVIAPQRFNTALPGNMLDLSMLRDTVQRIKPNLIVNAAAFTAVDLAEKDPSLARRVNALAPKMLANEALAMNAWLVHFSTDYVFNGQGTRPWTETDPGDPLNVYGRTKLEGDQAILASGCKHLILRTSWVYGLHGNNFAKTILEKAQTQDSLKVVNDQFGAPTSAELLASLTTQALLPAMKNPKLGGLYHVAAQGEASWYTYAQFLLEQALQEGLTLRVKPEDLIPVSSAQWPAPAARPGNSRLNTTKFCETFGLTLPHWQDGVAQFVRAYAKLNKR